MAPTPASSRPATAVPGVVAEVADCLGGTVHLAYARASGLDVVAAGFARYEERTRARAIARASALDELHRMPYASVDQPPPHDAPTHDAPRPPYDPAAHGGPRSPYDLDVSGVARSPYDVDVNGPRSPYDVDVSGAAAYGTDRYPGAHGGPRRGGRPRGRELRLGDFMAGAPEAVGPAVAGTGLVSGNPYRVPVEVVWLGERETRVEPVMSGVVDLGVSEGIAEVVAHDIVARWWAAPDRQPLLRVSGQLDRLLPAGVMAAAQGLGLRVSAFALSVPDVRAALVMIGGEGATLGVAAGRTVRSAVGEAFLRAMAAKAQPWATLTPADSLRRFAVWNHEADYAALLERLGVEAEPWLVDEPGDLRPSSWPEIAARRFGHEPVAVESGAAGVVVKVVCPGAACYGAAPTRLPCPVP